MIRICTPINTAAGRVSPHLKRLQVFALLGLHRWLPMLSHLLG